MVEQNQKLNYLDPDWYVPLAKEHCPDEYICVVCTGVVLDPHQCEYCDCIYCKQCVAPGQNCPKRCGSTDYRRVNRLVMNKLNELKFKCKYNSCDKVDRYETYVQHVNTCPERKNICTSIKCTQKIKDLQDQLLGIQDIINQQDREINVLKNQKEEIKQQFREKMQQVNEQNKQVQKPQESPLKYMNKIEELELKIAKQESQITQLTSKNEELKKASSVNIMDFLKKVGCPNGHLMKQKTKHPTASQLSCDICMRTDVLEQNFFFRCDSLCNFDLCSCCYFLALTGQNEQLKAIKEAAMRARQAKEMTDLIRTVQMLSLIKRLE